MNPQLTYMIAQERSAELRRKASSAERRHANSVSAPKAGRRVARRDGRITRLIARIARAEPVNQLQSELLVLVKAHGRSCWPNSAAGR